jgi:nitrogen fixation protein NifU and related proteins
MDQLYREELMDLYKHPPNRGKMDDPTVSTTKKNPVCGDLIDLQLKVDDRGKITAAKFDGMACSVTVISSAMLTEALKGKTVAEAKAITKEKLLGDLNLNLTTSRVKCATLPLVALEDLLEEYGKKHKV